MAGHVCPWWLGYLLASPLRRLVQDPARLLAPHVREGMTVLEPGPGMGFFTLELARRVGPSGRVVALEIQERMLAGLRRRLANIGLLERVDARLVPPHTLALRELEGRVDFALAFALVHELPEVETFFQELARALKPGGTLLLAEPRGHVTAAAFEGEIQAAAEAGLIPVERPPIRRSHAALLRRE